MSEPKSILIIRLSALGDVINTLPVLSELKKNFPESRITWLVEKESAEVVEVQPEVAETIVVPRKQWRRSATRPGQWAAILSGIREMMHRLRSKRFDAALDFQGNFRSGFLLAFCGAKRRIAFAPGDRRECMPGASTEAAMKLNGSCHRVEKALHLLRPLGVQPGPADAFIPISDGTKERVDQFLVQAGLNERPLIAIHPGTSVYGAYKRWTDEGYCEVVHRLIAEHGAGVVFTWAGRERESVEQLVRTIDSPQVCVSLETSLLELGALYQRCDLFLGADTGPGHLASLMKTPVVSIFGPKDPAIYRPYFSPCYVVERDLWCRPCISRYCSAPVCLRDIRPDAVYQKVLEALGKSRQLPVLGQNV